MIVHSTLYVCGCRREGVDRPPPSCRRHDHAAQLSSWHGNTDEPHGSLVEGQIPEKPREAWT